jgi:ATP-dependent phosphofructokinase / diphosphate-dependent phosphofructokinase
MRIGLLTGGGDCPGLNAVIRAVVRRAEMEHGDTIIGFHNGWKGMAEGDIVTMSVDSTRGLVTRGGTVLGTARYHPHEHPDGIGMVFESFKRNRLDAVICVGGDGTLAAAGELSEAGLPMVGVPKTIDNDVEGTDVSVGFDTAVFIAADALDRVQTTGESHNRVMVVEVMGRHNGWIAVSAGIAAGAEAILIPEDPFDVEDLAKQLIHRHRRARSSVVVVAEGATPRQGTLDWTPPKGKFGSIVAGAVGELVRSELEQRTGFDSRLTVLGHIQRGGTPTPADRILGSRFGVAAVDAVHDGDSGVMVGLQSEKVVRVPIAQIAGRRKVVPRDLVDVARSLTV